MFGQNDNNQDQNQAYNPSVGAPPAQDPVTDPSLGDNTAPDNTAPPVNNFGQNEFNSPSSLPPVAPAAPPVPVDSPSGGGEDDLLNIKQEALQQLSPLVSHLEQTPEEKFRTTMMMIQASDNQALIKDAYESAKQITDEKARAQALLDVVNEINYFSQQHNNNGS